jgi:hypothetical protein
MKPHFFRAAAGALALAMVLVVTAAARTGDAQSTISLPLVMTAAVIVDPDARLLNGSFEEGWTDMPPAPGNLVNQQPMAWTLSWLEPGDTLWDSNDPVTGVPEAVHKLKSQLPPNEWPGQPQALILDGEVTYKIFHFGAAFGGQLTQRIDHVPGGRYRLTFPVQIHLHENLDPNGDWDAYTVESGVWALTGGQQTGGWAHAKQMGDRTWFYHVLEFDVDNGAPIDVLIRVKSKYLGPKDFFMDAITLERIDNAAERVPENAIVWRARDLDAIPASERVSP